MGTKNKNLTFDDLVNISVKHKGDSKSKECKIDLEIEGETWQAYDVSISSRDLLFFTDKGTVTYLVDSYGDRHSAILHDWNSDNE